MSEQYNWGTPYTCDACGDMFDKEDLYKVHNTTFVCEGCLRAEEEIQQGMDLWGE